jgi:hypothetical protein
MNLFSYFSGIVKSEFLAIIESEKAENHFPDYIETTDKDLMVEHGISIKSIKGFWKSG